MKHMTHARKHAGRRGPARAAGQFSAASWATRSMCPLTASRGLLERLWGGAARGISGATLYGIEALEIMRTEKGFIHIGTDHRWDDLCRKISGFCTKPRAQRREFRGPTLAASGPRARRPQSIPAGGAHPPWTGRHSAAGGARADRGPPRRRPQSEGHVDLELLEVRSWMLRLPSACLARRPPSGWARKIRVHHLGKVIDAEVVKAPFIDPKGRPFSMDNRQGKTHGD